MNSKKATVYGLLLAGALVFLFFSWRSSGPSPARVTAPPVNDIPQVRVPPGSSADTVDRSWLDFWRSAEAALARAATGEPETSPRPVTRNPMQAPPAPVTPVLDPIIRDPFDPAEPAEPVLPPEEFKLTAIMMSESGGSALVNGEVVREGDAVGRESRVLRIEREAVFLGAPGRPETRLSIHD